MSEFAFELELCTTLEARREGIVARQLGASVADPGGRIVDVVLIEPGPQFDRRTALTPEAIPDAVLCADVGTGRWTPVRDAFDCHPDRARRAVERAVDIGFLERERRGGRDCIRQVARYPDWAGRIVAIENKPDLGTPGDLERQLRTDVSLGLVDEVILATESYVTGAHLNRIPEAVGVWRVHRNRPEDPVSVEVVREPRPLDVAEPGIEPVSYHAGRTDVAVVSAKAKRDARRRLAERAYGKGWRTFSFPACAAGCSSPSGEASTGLSLPYCRYLGRLVDAASECGPACSGYENAPAPNVDLADERDRLTPWNADPEAVGRRQSGLDRFGS
ncbi:DUF5787 family protein [Halovivax gelatinilyticus]|uniref:DUF5787 family protein n=1 Tax=Halovivax gelatinilyticus TaxID=2961597 RepID=UPI0020CA9554|nr:DUF5787 family protein [Halovivax gelatinilyticus]